MGCGSSSEDPKDDIIRSVQLGETDKFKKLAAQHPSLVTEPCGSVYNNAKLLHFTTTVEIAQEILKMDPTQINSTSDAGTTALHSVAGRGDVELARFLVENGADINPVSEGGRTPINYACRMSRDEDEKASKMIEYLLSVDGIFIHIPNVDKLSNLNEVATFGGEKSVTAMIEYCKNFSGGKYEEVITKAFGDRTPMASACEAGNRDAIKAFVDVAGVDINNVEDANGRCRSALHFLAQKNLPRKDSLPPLPLGGVEEPDEEFEAKQDIAKRAEEDMRLTLDFVIERGGADLVNKKDKTGDTALDTCFSAKCFFQARYLIDCPLTSPETLKEALEKYEIRSAGEYKIPGETEVVEYLKGKL